MAAVYGHAPWRGLVHAHTIDRQLGVHKSMELQSGRQKETPGNGPPDVELVAGLTGPWVCTVLIIDGKQTHTTKGRPGN